MSRHRGGIFLAALLAVALAGSAAAQVVQQGNVRLKFEGRFAPTVLPRERPVPIQVTIDGAVGTADGSPPPVLQRLRIALNRHGVLTTRGLPTCEERLLQSTSTQAALQRCQPALVGSGTFTATAFSAATKPVALSGRILAFNGRRHGEPEILLHLYETAPVTATLILPMMISHLAHGELSTILSAQVPRIAGGTGTVTSIHLTLSRRYRYQGKPRSYLSASCAALPGWNLALFPFARADFLLAGNQHLQVTVNGECHVRKGGGG
ncbi:MAG TPA: hypothetical protein VF731_08570 [Solirubrobacterales bacterium]